MTTPPSPVLEALRLRRWALAIMSGDRAPAPDASPDGWALFLGREGCAFRLRGAAGAEAPAPLRSAADADTQHILLLRAELADLATLARGVGVAPIVLKGGAAVHDPARAVRAKDLDLLLDPVGARALLAALDGGGWRAIGGGSGHHFAERCRPDRPPVEVHSTEGGAPIGLGPEVERRALPHPAIPGLRVLAPADQVRHFVIHQTIQHTAYRGRLRDLLLLADALSTAPAPAPAEWGLRPAELASVEGVLAMAREIGARGGTSDRFETLAALWYGMEHSVAGRPVTQFRQAMASWVFDCAAGDGSAWERWKMSWRAPLDDRTWFGPLMALERRAPLSVRTLRVATRIVRLPPLILWAALRARSEMTRARAAVALLDQ